MESIAELPVVVPETLPEIAPQPSSVSKIPANFLNCKRTPGGGRPVSAARFLSSQVATVRAQIKELNGRMKAALEAKPADLSESVKQAQAIKALAGAMKDLQEQERQLAGRSLPPQLRGEVRATVKSRAAQLLSGE